MQNFDRKFEVFLQSFIDGGGYNDVLTGLKNTLIIAVLGLIIGIVLGTLIGAVRVVPKTNPLIKVLDKICGVYVSLFRGTPMVVQLLVFYYVLMPIFGFHMNSVSVAAVVFGMNSGAF